MIEHFKEGYQNAGNILTFNGQTYLLIDLAARPLVTEGFNEVI